MDATLLDWLGLGLRWFHLVVAIGWIGTSFYFMWLDSSIRPPESTREGVEGEVWMVHSGHFYQVEMRRLRPGEVPSVLHWFKWEAALTWMSGVGLLAVVYYLTGGVYLVDPNVSKITTGGAVALCVGLLIVSWLVYDLLWVSPLGRDRAGVATAISYLLLLGMVILVCRTLSGRAAFIHVGAVLGTIMVANVWMRIIPAQRELIAATREGRPADWTLSDRAKRRSVHNSYVTMPVIFMMISNHYPATYGHRLNWLILCLFMVVGVGIRHFLITHEKHRPAAWVLAPVAAALAVLVYLTLPTAPAAGVGGPGALPGRPADRGDALCLLPLVHPDRRRVPGRSQRRRLRYAGERPAPRGGHQAARGAAQEHAAGQQDRHDRHRAGDARPLDRSGSPP
jgi:uncharacterized membrane protein